MIGFRRRDPDEDGDDVRFPEGLDDLTNTSFDSIPAEITLPPSLFRERRGPGSESTTCFQSYMYIVHVCLRSVSITFYILYHAHTEKSASISSVIFRNMEEALPDRYVILLGNDMLGA